MHNNISYPAQQFIQYKTPNSLGPAQRRYVPRKPTPHSIIHDKPMPLITESHGNSIQYALLPEISMKDKPIK